MACRKRSPPSIRAAAASSRHAGCVRKTPRPCTSSPRSSTCRPSASARSRRKPSTRCASSCPQLPEPGFPLTNGRRVRPFSFQDDPQVIRQVLRKAVVPDEQAQPPLRIDDVALRAVIDGIAGALLALLEVDLEVLRHALRRRQVAAQREEAGIEGAHVLRKL